MLEFMIGDVSIARWVSSCKIGKNRKKDDNAFEDWDGSSAENFIGYYVTLDVQLSAVPSDVFIQLSDLLAKGEANVSCSPDISAVLCTCERFDYESRSKGESWNITLSLKSAAPIGGSCL